MGNSYKEITEDIDDVSYSIDLKAVDEIIYYCNELKKKYSNYDELFFEYSYENNDHMVITLKGRRFETQEEYEKRIILEQRIKKSEKEKRRVIWERFRYGVQ